ncbi:DUF3949 domain-containing protein [Heyndrickxia sporothermodurans]
MKHFLSRSVVHCRNNHFLQRSGSMDIAFIIIWSVLILYFLVMIPIEYNNISSIKEQKKKTNMHHNEMYEKMSFEEEQLNFNLQGNLLNLPSNLVAALIYKLGHRNS